MNYYTVLGYSNNKILEIYKEKYFQKLLFFLRNRDIWEKLSLFEQHQIWDQKDFLLHPDVSSLLQEPSKLSHQKLLVELEYFLNNQQYKTTSQKWNCIPETNIRLSMSDNNPRNNFIWHPDHDSEKGMMWWWEKSESEWWEVFWKSFSLLKKINIDFYNELIDVIKKIVPMQTSLDVHNSCSYAECIGILYVWYTINAKLPELNILEALIHESSHNKLNLIMQSEKLHVNDASLQYYSPYRPDSRHIQWVLLWVHAIVPTVHVLLSGISKWYITDTTWYEKILLYHIKNKLWYRVLSRYGRFTTIGKSIFDDMWEVIKICDAMIQQSRDMQRLDFTKVQSRAKEHFLQVKMNNIDLQY
jgi:hypothetical protein